MENNRKNAETFLRDFGGNKSWVDKLQGIPDFVDLLTQYSLMTSNIDKEKCPKCREIEIDSRTPRTVYKCGSSDYDQRPNTFNQSDECKQNELAISNRTNIVRKGRKADNNMKDLYFKVINTQKISILEIEEIRNNPCFELYCAENEEKLITVSYKPTPGFKEDEFIKAIIKALKRKYKVSIVELLVPKGN